MSHVKRGRSYEAESISPSSKRMPSAASDDSGSKCNPVARRLESRYRQILPNPTVEKKSLEGGGSSSEESHLLGNVGSRNLKVGAHVFIFLYTERNKANLEVLMYKLNVKLPK